MRFPIIHIAKTMAKKILPPIAYEEMRSRFLRIFVLRKNRLWYPVFSKLRQGVNLYISNGSNSANAEADLLKLALESAGIPFNIFDLSDQKSYSCNVKGRQLFNINLVINHAASRIATRMFLYGINIKRHYNICYWAWELSEVPDLFCNYHGIFQEFWTLSSFCTNALAKKTKAPALTVPLYAHPDRSTINNGREYFNIEKDVFIFFVSYDCNSFVSRKNPQAAIQAFLKAFSPQDHNIGLIIKISNPEKDKEHIEDMHKALEEYQNVYFIDRCLSNCEMRTLIQISNAYVTLHRSEGFGLIPMEAMALGTPVISTAWSGNMEYMTHMNTALVGYNMVPVAGQYVGSCPGDGLVWADPDVNEAAMHMRRMVSDKEWREKLIANGKQTATACFNENSMGKLMLDRLEYLKLI